MTNAAPARRREDLPASEISSTEIPVVAMSSGSVPRTRPPDIKVPDAIDHVVSAAVRGELARLRAIAPETPPHLLVAFSGGPDSTALLAALAALRDQESCFVSAAHLDHGSDEDSARRGDHARSIAQHLRVPFVIRRISISSSRAAGESWEAAARRVRYGFLEEERHRCAAQWTATAHHADDQLETVLLRLGQGTGFAGLAGIRRRHGRVVRPLLSLRRRDLQSFLDVLGIRGADDPNNHELRLARAKVRHLFLPRMVAHGEHSDELAGAAGRLARRIASALPKLERAALRLAGADFDQDTASLRLGEWQRCAPAVGLFALRVLAERSAGRGLAPHVSHAAYDEIRRQLVTGATRGPAVALSADWRARRCDDLLVIERSSREERLDFSYRLKAPGEVRIPELSAALRITPTSERVEGSSAPPSPRALRVHLHLDDELGTELIVRSRRPGDRLRPLGSPGHRPLKKILADARFSPHHRWQLVLLCASRVCGPRESAAGAIATDESEVLWVPGVAVAERCRLREAPGKHHSRWWAELVFDPGAGAGGQAGGTEQFPRRGI